MFLYGNIDLLPLGHPDNPALQRFEIGFQPVNDTMSFSGFPNLFENGQITAFLANGNALARGGSDMREYLPSGHLPGNGRG